MNISITRQRLDAGISRFWKLVGILTLSGVIFGNASALDLKFLAERNLCAELPREPSGLALSHDGNSLWTVSDDSALIFRMDIEGRLLECFSIDVAGLEGIALDETGKFLYAVSEDKNEIIKIDVKSREKSRIKLKEMNAWGIIENEFENGDDSKGLEGITFRPGHAGTESALFVLKEGKPRLLGNTPNN